MALILAVVFAFALGHSWLHMSGFDHDPGLATDQTVSASCVLAKIAADDLPGLPLAGAPSVNRASFTIPENCVAGLHVVTPSARAPPLT